jgi:hypothetical protein
VLANCVQDALPIVRREATPHPEPGEQKRDRESAGNEHVAIVAQTSADPNVRDGAKGHASRPFAGA